MRRRLRYQVAMSVDGFIAGPDGGVSWIVPDDAIDFAALFAEFDTLVMGRKTYDAVVAQGEQGMTAGVDLVVFSRTLPASNRPRLTIVNGDPVAAVAALKDEPGRDIWLFGGGELCRTLLDGGLVDTMELAVMPVVLGSGVRALAPGQLARLTLADQKVLPASGIVILVYLVDGSAAVAPKISFVKGV
ncbi:MAG: dihydrofolate reductase family protein [Vicinamibacterales bacterium]